MLSARNCPLEVVELHVIDDPKNSGARDIQFRLHNKTNKPVTRYRYDISDEHEEGSISFGTGVQKDSIGLTAPPTTFTKTAICTSIGGTGSQIDHVAFADGTEWTAPESSSHKKAE